MYSILPALISVLFLGYGLYVVFDKGFTRVGATFFALCVATFFWQGTWAALFQARDPAIAMPLIRFGYLLIVFLPTTLYHFLIEIAERPDERRLAYLSYGVAAALGLFVLLSDRFVSGYYEFFWGYYPKAGPLHPLHVLQTVAVVGRGLYIAYRQQRNAPAYKRTRLRLCIVALFIYFFAAVDYLCNYGFEFYPPGVVFVAVSLGIMTVAIAKYDLLNPMSVAASVAHEMRTPLLTIRMQAMAMAKFWPALSNGYRLAVEHGLCEPAIRPATLERLSKLSSDIAHEVDRSNAVIDMMLAAATMEQLDCSTFRTHSADVCLSEALRRYPFDPDERAKVRVDRAEDFRFYGSDTLLVYVLFNLLKNALYAIKAAGKGKIDISLVSHSAGNSLVFMDTALGIAPEALPHVFDAFFTTKKSSGTGIGLAFCRRVMMSFGGRIWCDSQEGEYATFVLEFPPAAD